MSTARMRRGGWDNDPHGGMNQQRGDVGSADPDQHAREICLRLLTARPRARSELAAGLARRGIDEQVADRVLARLEEAGLIDDAAFAQNLVHSRHSYQGLARRALTAELQRKGVAEPLAKESVSVIDEEAEEERARQLVRHRLRREYRGDEAARVRRLVGMLARKGYSAGMAVRVVREELSRVGEDTAVLDDDVLTSGDLDVPTA